jgi:hypothetical protein
MMATILFIFYYFQIIFIFHEIKIGLLTPTNQLANHINKKKLEIILKKCQNLYTIIKEHKN